jgi:hypothetical protein
MMHDYAQNDYVLSGGYGALEVPSIKGDLIFINNTNMKLQWQLTW